MWPKRLVLQHLHKTNFAKTIGFNISKMDVAKAIVVQIVKTNVAETLGLQPLQK